MNWRHLILFLVGLLYAVWHFAYRPLPALLENPILDLVAYHTPRFYFWMVWWYYLSPLVAVMLAGLILLAVWRVWFEARSRSLAPLGMLPDWPLKPGDPGPGIVVGELHHPVAIRQISNPSWLTIPDRGPVHRRGHIRGRRVRKDLGLHAPLRFTASRLASRKPAPAGGGPGAGSQGGLLP